MFKVCINYRWNAFESSNISLKCSKPPRFMTHPIILNVETADLMHCCVPLKKSEDPKGWTIGLYLPFGSLNFMLHCIKFPELIYFMTNFLRNYSCMSRMFHRLSSTINVWPTANDHSLQLWRFSSYNLILLNFEWCLPCKTGMWILFASFILVWFIFNVSA